MEIRINEDGSTSIKAAGYTAFYGKNGGLKLISGGSNSILSAPATLVIHNAFKQKAEKEQTSKTYPAGMELAVEKSAEAMVENAEMIYQVAAGIHEKEAIINAAKIIKAHDDDHIRQIVREELDKTLRPGGPLYHAALYRGAW
ncbi:hypothetical protein PSI23_17745 [Xenorhabdus sp. XENO-10]|uniref:Uncharacterized protein n=1 Tax=Xenorhabdus yunnanensis TaxID=3025878 RepID=A0ABT5LIZ5_9GAMM|nr:hypothetical protein [Xenorhabdus yunnanensis]MDC9591079.1 hypothetical protein [Xenorhabdus yunnanensis]